MHIFQNETENKYLKTTGAINKVKYHWHYHNSISSFYTSKIYFTIKLYISLDIKHRDGDKWADDMNDEYQKGSNIVS